MSCLLDPPLPTKFLDPLLGFSLKLSRRKFTWFVLWISNYSVSIVTYICLSAQNVVKLQLAFLQKTVIHCFPWIDINWRLASSICIRKIQTPLGRTWIKTTTFHFFSFTAVPFKTLSKSIVRNVKEWQKTKQIDLKWAQEFTSTNGNVSNKHRGNVDTNYSLEENSTIRDAVVIFNYVF